MNNNLFVCCHPPEISAPQISRVNCQTLSTPCFPIPDFRYNFDKGPRVLPFIRFFFLMGFFF